MKFILIIVIVLVGLFMPGMAYASSIGATTIGMYPSSGSPFVGTHLSATGSIIVKSGVSDGFVSGGGWYYSEAGSDTENPGVKGKVNFGFISKYKKGGIFPTGHIEFQFKAGDLNFRSTEYQWLIVNIVNQDIKIAQFEGIGTINGIGDCKFMVWAGDGNPDTFRIRIWTEDIYGTENVRYDNGYEGSGYENGQPIACGSIVIHKSKK